MALTRTPRARWGDFFARPAAPAWPDRSLAWTLNGRNALFLGLRALAVPQGAAVLLPAFHCTAVVDPILAYGARPVYYRVDRGFGLDLEEIDTLITKTKAAAVLCIHYFGFPAPAPALAELCRRRGAALIEDCSHALYGRLPAGPLGGFGDIALFSFRKTLAVQDGGVLLLPRSRPGRAPGRRSPFLYQVRMAKWTWDSLRSRGDDPADPQAAPAAGPSPHAGAYDPKKGPLSHDDPTFVEPLAEWPMSTVSRWLLARSSGVAVTAARRARYQRLGAALAGLAAVKPCFPSLPEGVCPMAFPLLADLPFRLDYRLRREGVPAFSFGEDLSPTLPAGEFPDAEYLSRHLVLLPVHQGLEERDLDRMAETVRRVAGAGERA